MRLVACPTCHAQYDVSDVAGESFPCRCGETLSTTPLRAVDAEIARCGACGAVVGAESGSCAYCGSEIVRDPDALSLICPECYARNAEEARFCTACGVAFRPEAVRPEGYEIPCPACGPLMPPRQVGGVGVNECAACHGLWVPGESFERLVSRALEARRNADPAALAALRPRVTGGNPAAQGIRYRRCPVCDAHMQRRNFRRASGVIVDVCRTHGTWLDADELEGIAGFLMSADASPAVAPRPESPLPPEVAESLARARVAREMRNLAQRDRPRSLVGSLVDALATILD